MTEDTKKAEEVVEEAAEEVVDATEEVTTVEETPEVPAEDEAAATEEVAEAKEAPEAESSEEEAEADSPEDEKTTKAGKNSAKAKREAEELAEKEERKAKVAAGEIDASTNADGEVVAARGPVPITRPKSERRSKKYKEAAKKIEAEKLYSLGDAVKLAKETSTTKFDASVEYHVRLGVDPKQADQNIRGTVVLPHGTGKTVRVAVLAGADDQAAAKKAGADIAGEETLIEDIKSEKLDFDVLIATPDQMAKLGQLARILGPKGLMPNPKSGTVTKDVAKAVEASKKGQVEYRVDETGIIHLAVGKVSFEEKQLAENITVIAEAISAARPSNLKGIYQLSSYLTTSMGPSIKLKG